MVVIDAHSKWIDAHWTSSTNSAITIEKLMQTFANHGLPKSLVSDNGTSFTSADFVNFMKHNGIQHIRSSPYHPATNGLAERAVQIIKGGLKKTEGVSLDTRLSKVLARYRVTPQSTTGRTPAEMMYHRQIRSRLDLLIPDASSKVLKSQNRQKSSHDRVAMKSSISVGQMVHVRNFGHGAIWLDGEIVSQTGPLSFMVQLHDGRVLR